MRQKVYTTILGVIVSPVIMAFFMVNCAEVDMNKSKLIGRIAEINEGYYAGHWGVIKDFDGDTYTITEGSIGDLYPIFDRDEFVVKSKKKVRKHSKKKTLAI